VTGAVPGTLAAAAAAAYAALGMVSVLASGWLWTRPGLVSGAVAGAVVSVTVVMPWWLLTVLAYAPAGPDTALAAALVVCTGCAVLAGWRSR
jgi:hypothetical protein